jgi:hypothetical protein
MRKLSQEIWDNCHQLPGCKPSKPTLYTSIESTPRADTRRQNKEQELIYSIQHEGLRAIARPKVVADLGLFHNPYKNNISRQRWVLVQCPICGIQWETRATTARKVKSCQLCMAVVRRVNKLIKEYKELDYGHKNRQ